MHISRNNRGAGVTGNPYMTKLVVQVLPINRAISLSAAQMHRSSVAGCSGATSDVLIHVTVKPNCRIVCVAGACCPLVMLNLKYFTETYITAHIVAVEYISRCRNSNATAGSRRCVHCGGGRVLVQPRAINEIYICERKASCCCPGQLGWLMVLVDQVQHVC